MTTNQAYTYTNADAVLFIEHLQQTGRFSPLLLDQYRITVESFLAKKPDLTKLEDYNTFLTTSRTGRPRSYLTWYGLKKYIMWKLPKGLKREEILEGIRIVRPSCEPRYLQKRTQLSEFQLQDLEQALTRDWSKILMLVEKTTGVRVGELLRLKEGDVDIKYYRTKNPQTGLDEEVEVVRLQLTGKGNKLYTAYIFDEYVINKFYEYLTSIDMEKIVIKHRSRQPIYPYYFLRSKLRHLQNISTHAKFARVYRNVYQVYLMDLKQALQKTGVDPKTYATHDFRRHCASKFYLQTKDIRALQLFLNHTKIENTIRYLKYSGLQVMDMHYMVQKGYEPGKFVDAPEPVTESK